MSDLGRFLPLSNRPPADESAVSGDRRGQIADIVTAAAGVIGQCAPERAPSLASAFLATAGLERDAAPSTPPADTGPGTTPALATLATVAERVRGGRRRSGRHLARATRAYLLLARDAKVAPQLSAAVTGAVALSASTTAPFARRAAIAGHTVQAVDHGWQFGRGPLLAGSAVQIVSFLLGVTDEPPRRSAGAAPGTLEE
ncbi:hypothetical protein QNO21_09045 [Microbacterium sp. zg-Y818]|uniref:hypothetical protein n=1 Tax=unclassified Microbacterium TaxID=2609290 RepID=UPI00214C291C|nr:MULTISPECIES: hypothetical protein [unclassified Microbacterium]MCR2799267.1 hypothetical protein [Microbacterium sp. zg.Y818]WIM21270.1 hypothetical protein QNO21_09045 [Microbacterium sp. zg-Y818]